MTKRTTTTLLGLILLGILIFEAVLLWATPASGQHASPQPVVFEEAIDVRVVHLEAVVTHRRGAERGEHVRGLSADDFVLEIDGEVVPIEFFSEVREGRARAGEVAPGPTTALPVRPAGEPVPTRILVFVDNFYSIASRRDLVLRRLSEQVAELGPHDHVAVVAYDGTSLTMISSWSRDAEAIRQALRRVEQLPAFGLQRRSDFARLQTLASYGKARGFERGASSSGLSASSYSSIGFRGARREPRFDPQLDAQLSGQVSRVALAATSALRGFARPDGRKLMLLLSGGLPAVGDGGLASIGDAAPWAGEPGSYGTGWSEMRGDRAVLAPLVDTANRLGYTIYPVDLGASGASELPSAADATVADSQRRRSVQRELEFFSEDALLFLARATGGEAYLDASRFVALDRVLEDTRSYYWIGFTPTWRQDDGLHRIELRTRRAGTEVRARDSFSDLSRASLVSLQVESAHLFDAPLGAEASGGLRVTLGQVERSGVGRMRVPLRLTLPLDHLTLVPTSGATGPGSWRGRAEIRFVASDDRGEVSPVPVLEVDLVSDAEPAAGSVQTFEATLELRRRPHRLLVAVHDPVSGALFGERLHVEP